MDKDRRNRLIAHVCIAAVLTTLVFLRAGVPAALQGFALAAAFSGSYELGLALMTKMVAGIEAKRANGITLSPLAYLAPVVAFFVTLIGGLLSASIIIGLL